MRTLIVVAGIIIENERVLLTQRKAGAHLAGLWEFPGGKVNEGEDPRDALVRELHEEIGIDATVNEIVEVTHFRYEEAQKTVLLLFYACARKANSPVASAIDVAALRWASAHELEPALFPPADVDVLAKVRGRLSRSLL